MICWEIVGPDALRGSKHAAGRQTKGMGLSPHGSTAHVREGESERAREKEKKGGAKSNNKDKKEGN